MEIDKQVEIIRVLSNRPKCKEYLVYDEWGLLNQLWYKWLNGFEDGYLEK